jgi:hypothetical protein
MIATPRSAMDGMADRGAALPLVELVGAAVGAASEHANAVDTVETESEQILVYFVATVDDESESAQSYPTIVELSLHPDVSQPELHPEYWVAIEPATNFLKEVLDESFW